MKARILIVDDEADLTVALKQLLDKEGFNVSYAYTGEDGLALLEEEDFHLIYLDYQLPGISGLEFLEKMREMNLEIPVIFITAHGDDTVGLRSLELGACDFLHKPVDTKNLRFKAFQWIEKNVMASDTVTKRASSKENPFDMICESEEMKKVLKLIGKVAPTNVPVMIYGETGTGKEVVAKSICKHHGNPRKDKTCITLNCAAMPEHLMESELFGHVKGAYTGAVSDRDGVFGTALGGTLFLDELSSASLSLQAKLLRVVENGEYTKVGESITRKTDVRILAATNKNIQDEIKSGTMREDLYHRISVVQIDIPPLRKRKEDIAQLIEGFLDQYNKEYHHSVKLNGSSIQVMKNYYWPGNVRELKHLIQNLVITSGKKVITRNDLPERIAKGHYDEKVKTYSDFKEGVVKEFEKNYLLDLIDAANGNVSKAARVAELSRVYMIAKLKEHGIDPKKV